jgi:membrane-associated phospholipid phosphatase
MSTSGMRARGDQTPTRLLRREGPVPGGLARDDHRGPEAPRTVFPSLREWGAFTLQVGLVVGIELSDDITRGMIAPRAPEPAQANALQVMHFEQEHGFWIEPAIQRYFEHPHRLPGLEIDWGQVVPLVNALYGVAHGLVTIIFAIWLFWRRPALFPFVRNVFLFATAFSVALYNIFPLAPPRLATGLSYQGLPFHFIDTVFVGDGVNLSFDQYAAMPSLHVVWALIVGLTLAWTARPWAVRLIGLIYPVLMSVAVIVTGNHYIVDCLGGAAVVVAGYILALAVAAAGRRRRAGQ